MNLAGTYLGKYQLIERLGQGGMAQVYRAVQPTIERQVAIKVLHSHLAASPGFVDRFKREARGLGQLHHPHIVQIIDFDVEGELYYMVMDFIPGKTLRVLLDERGAMSAVETLAISEQLAEALAYAHRRGVIHRDVKPSNVLFRDEACTDAVLTDFGIGRLLDDATMTMSGSVIGTPAYMSPEAGLGQRVDARADLYSLGIIMHEMVTGQVPYSGDTPLSVIMKQVHEPLPPLRQHHAGLPEALVRVIERALQKDVANRYQSAEEMAADLRAARAVIEGRSPGSLPPVTLAFGERSEPPAVTVAPAAPSPGTPPPAAPVAPPPETLTPPVPASARPQRWLLYAAGGLIVVLLAGLWLLGGRSRDQVATAPTTAPQAPTEAALSVAQAPTEETAPTAAAPDPSLTAAPAPPTLEPTAEPSPLLAGSAGTLAFADSADLAAGRYLLRLDRVPLPPGGSRYRLWLQGGDGAPADAGTLSVQTGRILQEGTLAAPMIAPGSRVLVSLEPEDSAPSAPGDQIVFAGELPDAYAAALRRVLIEDAGQPGRLAAAADQALIAADHARFAQEALATGDLALAKRHSEHVVNILDGADGEFFGDLNGDGQAENPGDNVGVRRYLLESREQIEAALAAGEPTDERRIEGAAAGAAVDRAQALVSQATTSARQVIASESLTLVEPLVEAMNEQVRILVGDDTDAGPLAAAYRHTLALAAIPLLAEQELLPPPDAAATDERVGTFSLAGGGAGRAGDVRLELGRLVPPPAAFHYDAWLLGEGQEPLHLGELSTFDQYGSLAGSFDIDRLTTYERVVVSLERDGDPNLAPGGTLAYEGALPAGADLLVTRLLSASGADGAGPLFSADEQTGIAEQHLQFAREAQAEGDLVMAQRHLEHVVNILDGADGVFFGDLNFDGQAENPGDNIGTRGHLVRVVELVQGLQEQGALATANQEFYAGQLITTAELSMETIEATIDRAKKVLASDTLDEAAVFLEETGVLLGQVRTGRDSDGNGVVDLLLAEGGLAGIVDFALAVDEVDIVPATTAASGKPLFSMALRPAAPLPLGAVRAERAVAFVCEFQ